MSSAESQSRRRCLDKFASIASGMADRSDHEVRRNLERLSRRERRTTIEILLHLVEVEKRKIHAKAGYRSLFDYCTRGLRYLNLRIACAPAPAGAGVLRVGGGAADSRGAMPARLSARAGDALLGRCDHLFSVGHRGRDQPGKLRRAAANGTRQFETGD